MIWIVIGIMACICGYLFYKLKSIEKNYKKDLEDVLNIMEECFKKNDELCNKNFKKVAIFHKEYCNNMKIANLNDMEIDSRLKNLEHIVKVYGLEFGGNKND